jgi:hypothetical protein
MKRRPAVEALAIEAPTMALAAAIERLPTDNKAFYAVRNNFVRIVRGHPMLSAAQRHIALAIAQQFINRNPENAWFNSAWASHQTLATQTGYTRRTVISAMALLKRVGVIAIECGGGQKGPGGRTDRYTLRIDWLGVLEHAGDMVRRKDVKNFQHSDHYINNQFDKSCEKITESGEIDRQMRGNSSTEGVKQLPTTLSNSIPLESSFTTIDPLSDASRFAAIKQASNGSEKKASYVLTAQDHHELALLVGDGDVEQGYGCLDGIADANINTLALRYRVDRSSGQSIRVEVVELMSALGSRT